MKPANRIDLDVAILGGGFAGVYCARETAKRLGKRAADRVALISDENYMVFQPMLPEVTGGTISPQHVISPLRLLCRPAHVFKGTLESIQLRDRTLVLNAGPFSGNILVSYEQLVLALGAAVDLSKIPGMPEHAFLMRNVGDAMYLRSTIIGRIEEANLEKRPEIKHRLLTFVVVGGGYSGVETAGHIVDLFRSVHQFYPHISGEDLVVYLVHSRDHLLPTLSRRLGDYSARKLQQRGLKLLLNERVKAVTADRVYLQSGKTIETNTVVATVGNGPHPLVKSLCNEHGLESVKGQIVTDEYCRVAGDHQLWAAGDCAAVPYVEGGHCPNTAQFAMRQGTLIGRNIGSARRGKQPAPFTFKGFGEMASIGHHVAVADVLGMTFSGFFAWWLWRSVYLWKLPRLERKIRVALDWTLDLFFPRDINHLSPRFSEVLQEVYLEPGDVLFERGEPAFSLYIVKKGLIEMDDGQNPPRCQAEGDYFGEAALLGDGVWNESARAVRPTRLVTVPAKVFQQIVSGTGSLARFFKKSAAKYKSHEAMDLLARKMPRQFIERPISEFMKSEVYVLEEGMKVEEALRVARDHPRSSHPLVDPAGKLVGVVEREDFYEFIKRPDTHADSKLTNVQTVELPLFRPEATVMEVLKGMTSGGANKAVMIDAEGRPVGVITILDLLTASCSDDLRVSDPKAVPYPGHA